jgi:hypothetical protein
MILPQKVVSGGADAGLTIVSVTINVNSVASASTNHFEIWSNSSGSPVAQIGADSESKSLSSTGDTTFSFPTPVPVPDPGNSYWIIQQASGGDVNVNRGSSISSGVTGGDFILPASETITDFVVGSSILPRLVAHLSDGTSVGQTTGTTAIGTPGTLLGLLITNAA